MKKLAILFVASLSATAYAQQPLFIPDTLSGTVFNLTMHNDSVQFLPGSKTATMAFNINAYLGPTLIMQKGTTVNITVNNQIGDTTNIHWHGFHVAPTNDGPRQNIMPGMNWKRRMAKPFRRVHAERSRGCTTAICSMAGAMMWTSRTWARAGTSSVN